MAAIPIVDTLDKRVGIVASVVAMTTIIILLLLITFEFSDPPPKDQVVVAETIMPDEIVLEDLVVETSAGSNGAPNDNPVDKPQEQVQEVITQPNNPTQSPSGHSDVTNGSNTNNPPSSAQNSDNPFNSGGNSTDGPGHSTGNDGPLQGGGSGTVAGGGPSSRNLIKLPDWSSISRDLTTKVTVTLNLTIDTDGNVVHAYVVQSKTTTSNNVLIQKIKNLVISSAKFNKVPGNGTTQLQYGFVVRPQ